MTRKQRLHRGRVVTYLTCLAAITFLLVVGITRGGHG